MGKQYLNVFVQGIVIFCSLSAPVCAFQEENLQKIVVPGKDDSTVHSMSAPDEMHSTSPDPAQLGLHMDVGGQYVQYRDLDEPYQFNPAANLMPLTSSGWEHSWQEKRVWLRMIYEPYRSSHFLLQPGLLLGAVQCRFTASNADLHFSEEWRTKPALLWGVSLAGELRADQERGPFLRVQYQFSRAKADEEQEILVSNNPRTSGDDRDARFRWQESGVNLTVGYHWRSLKPMVGIAYSDFRLQKWLSYHIPETGLSNADLQIVRALNGQESEYHFRNNHAWAALLSLEWKITPAWALVADSVFAGYENYSVALRWSY
jgi:hypothetical protein